MISIFEGFQNFLRTSSCETCNFDSLLFFFKWFATMESSSSRCSMGPRRSDEAEVPVQCTGGMSLRCSYRWSWGLTRSRGWTDIFWVINLVEKYLTNPKIPMKIEMKYLLTQGLEALEAVGGLMFCDKTATKLIVLINCEDHWIEVCWPWGPAIVEEIGHNGICLIASQWYTCIYPETFWVLSWGFSKVHRMTLTRAIFFHFCLGHQKPSRVECNRETYEFGQGWTT